METFVALIKLGALGASFAFLYLSYQLLQEEQKLKDKDGNPAARPEFLAAIANFRRAALTFLIAGVFLEFFLSQGPLVLAAMNQSILKSDMIRVRFADWGFEPEARQISFSFEENRLSTAGFVPSAVRDNYRV
jgi:hypothetical protein